MAEESTSDESSDTSGSDDSAPSAVCTSFGHGAEFTFRVPVQEPVDDAAFVELARTATASDRSLKRPKGHPDGPTPASSPQKKRIRAPDTDHLPLPSLLFPLSSVAPSSIGSDVFGSEANVTDDTTSTNGTLFSFWPWETAQDRAERDSCEFEELRMTRETQALTEERDKATREARQRVSDRE